MNKVDMSDEKETNRGAMKVSDVVVKQWKTNGVASCTQVPTPLALSLSTKSCTFAYPLQRKIKKQLPWPNVITKIASLSYVCYFW